MLYNGHYNINLNSLSPTKKIKLLNGLLSITRMLIRQSHWDYQSSGEVVYLESKISTISTNSTRCKHVILNFPSVVYISYVICMLAWTRGSVPSKDIYISNKISFISYINYVIYYIYCSYILDLREIIQYILLYLKEI